MDQLLVPSGSRVGASKIVTVGMAETPWGHEAHEKQEVVSLSLLSAPFVMLYPQLHNLLGGRATVTSVLKDSGEGKEVDFLDKNFKEGVGSYLISTESLGTITMPPKPYRLHHST